MISWVGWQVSHFLAVAVMGAPNGWTVCALLGVKEQVKGYSSLACIINFFFWDYSHCETAMFNAIDRQCGE